MTMTVTVTGTSPLGCTWQRYLDQLADEHGGWTALTRVLMRRAGHAAGLPEDPGTVERGLRRLKSRGNAPGGQYGDWLLHYFGVPHSLEDTARLLGQYHSRFADLPLSLREAQLWSWDRPPIAESSAACWIHLGLASVALRRKDLDDARLRLARVGDTAHPAAQVESALFNARMAMDSEQHTRAEALLTQTQAQIALLPPGQEQDCYQARCADQRAYHAIHAIHAKHADPETRLPHAIRLYESINARSPAAFARFRRDHGLAYCHWKLGDHDRAVRHARAAVDHAGDAGLLRFRVLALHLLAHIEPNDARTLHRRADAIIAELEHADLQLPGSP